MQFTISAIEKKTSASGKSYAKATLKDTNGIEKVNVTLWSPQCESKVGETLTGELTPNDFKGQVGWNFKAETTSTIFTKKAGNFTKAMETKAENIKEAQERKNDAIKLASLQRDAVLIVTTFYRDSLKLHNDEEMEMTVKAKIEEWKKHLDKTYGDGVPF